MAKWKSTLFQWNILLSSTFMMDLPTCCLSLPESIYPLECGLSSKGHQPGDDKEMITRLCSKTLCKLHRWLLTLKRCFVGHQHMWNDVQKVHCFGMDFPTKHIKLRFVAGVRTWSPSLYYLYTSIPTTSEETWRPRTYSKTQLIKIMHKKTNKTTNKSYKTAIKTKTHVAIDSKWPLWARGHI